MLLAFQRVHSVSLERIQLLTVRSYVSHVELILSMVLINRYPVKVHVSHVVQEHFKMHHNSHHVNFVQRVLPPMRLLQLLVRHVNLEHTNQFQVQLHVHPVNLGLSQLQQVKLSANYAQQDSSKIMQVPLDVHLVHKEIIKINLALHFVKLVHPVHSLRSLVNLCVSHVV